MNHLYLQLLSPAELRKVRAQADAKWRGFTRFAAEVPRPECTCGQCDQGYAGRIVGQITQREIDLSC
jgi:hypothetical protein